MNAENATLRDMCHPDDETLRQSKGTKKLLKSKSEGFKITTVAWSQVEDLAAQKLAGLFDVKLADILTAAWGKNREIRELAEEQQNDPDTETTVTLMKHDIVSEHHPSIDIEVAGVKACHLDFDLEATLEVTGGGLTLKAGRIVAFKIGTCAVEATLKSEGLQLLQTESNTADFGPPIKLPAPGIALVHEPAGKKAGKNSVAGRNVARTNGDPESG